MPAARTVIELVRASSLFFGGPLLGDPDRRHQTTARLARACRRAGSAKASRPPLPFGNTSIPLRDASRA